MQWNKRNLIAGIVFIIAGIYCLYCVLSGHAGMTSDMLGVSDRKTSNSYFITGTIAFLIVGIAFLKRSKR